MKAQEMFQKIGYDVYLNNEEELIYTKERYNKETKVEETAFIIFCIPEKLIGGILVFDQDMEEPKPLAMDISEIKAVTEQIKEFKWNEEVKS